MLLALGLNVAVGWVGLLDLGFVAFFGLGAYLYAVARLRVLGPPLGGAVGDSASIASPSPRSASCVGLPSRRLVGDYLAIVTLFFLQIWLVVARSTRSLHARAERDLGHLPARVLRAGSHARSSGYFYVALVAFVVVISRPLPREPSRTGRAWRALREDELAAELMTMPVNRLKLMAFAVGAGVAGARGRDLRAACRAPSSRRTSTSSLLITVYAMVDPRRRRQPRSA